MANQPDTGTVLQQDGNTNFRYADNPDGTKNVGAPVIDNFIKSLFGGTPPTNSNTYNRGGFGPTNDPGTLPTVQIGTTAPTPALGIQSYNPQQTNNDPFAGTEMDLTGERRFATPPVKPQVPQRPTSAAATSVVPTNDFPAVSPFPNNAPSPESTSVTNNNGGLLEPDNASGLESLINTGGRGIDDIEEFLANITNKAVNAGDKFFTRSGPEQDARITDRNDAIAENNAAYSGNIGTALTNGINGLFDNLSSLGDPAVNPSSPEKAVESVSMPTPPQNQTPSNPLDELGDALPVSDNVPSDLAQEQRPGAISDVLSAGDAALRADVPDVPDRNEDVEQAELIKSLVANGDMKLAEQIMQSMPPERATVIMELMAK